jgi:hypothetical protein
MELNPVKITKFGNIKDNGMYASFEHIIPKSQGGKTKDVLAHASCNRNREKRKWPHDPVFGKGNRPGVDTALNTDGSARTGDRALTLPPIGELTEQGSGPLGKRIAPNGCGDRALSSPPDKDQDSEM